MKQKISVLSLFDGIGGARVALFKAGFDVNEYYRVEIDPYVNQTYYYNWHDDHEQRCAKFISYGDIDYFDYGFLKNRIDLVIASPPCQPFSKSGLRKGFDDPRTRHMITTTEIIDFLQPTYFLVENVVMEPYWRNQVNSLFGLYAKLADAGTISPQKRRRFVWTNIAFEEPEYDSEANLGQILQYPDDDWGGVIVDGRADIPGGNRQQTQIDYPFGKSRTLTANSRAGGQIKVAYDCGDKDWKIADKSDFKRWRSLSAIELERLQGFPDDYTKIRSTYFRTDAELNSKTSRIKMLGNAFQCDMFAHILSYMEF